MKLVIIILFTVLNLPLLHGQNKQDSLLVNKLFNSGIEFYEEADYYFIYPEDYDLYDDEELEEEKRLREKYLFLSREKFSEIVKNHMNSHLYPKSLYNVAVIEEELGNIGDAKYLYKKILESDFDEMESGGVGGGIMGDPYALFKHNSAKRLAELSLETKDYKKALKYISLTEKYPYAHTSGNRIASNQIIVAKIYAKSYIGLNEIDRALYKTMPLVIESGLANNRQLVDLSIELLQTKYSVNQLKSELLKAKNEIFQQDSIDEIHFTSFYTKYFDYILPIPHRMDISDSSTWIEEHNTTEEIFETYKYLFENSTFFKLISELDE